MIQLRCNTLRYNQRNSNHVFGFLFFVEYINKFENIKAYYSYIECGYEEYNYDEDFKKELLDILKGVEK